MKVIPSTVLGEGRRVPVAIGHLLDFLVAFPASYGLVIERRAGS